MKIFPVFYRSAAIFAAGVASWPVLAAAVVHSAGVGGCVRSHGLTGFLATHGGMMREVSSCPASQVGLPATIDTRVSVMLAVAIVVTVMQGLIAILGTSAAEWVHRVAETLWGIIAPVLAVMKPIVDFQIPALARETLLGSAGSVQVPWRRGPPVWGAAAA